MTKPIEIDKNALIEMADRSQSVGESNLYYIDGDIAVDILATHRADAFNRGLRHAMRIVAADRCSSPDLLSEIERSLL